jgi:hypothetical protein
VTLTPNEGYVIMAAIVTALLVGFVTHRLAVALLPIFGLVAFLAYAWTSDDRYSQIPEDVQATVVFALVFSSALALVGVLARRIVDAERLHRRSCRQLE